MSNHNEIPDDLLKRCAGRVELAERIITRFHEQMDEDLPKLAQLVTYGDAEAIRRAAHRIKGAAANVAAEEVRAQAAQLEHLAADNLLDQVQASLDQLTNDVRSHQELMSSPMAG